jgi:hypothetical protein
MKPKFENFDFLRDCHIRFLKILYYFKRSLDGNTEGNG